MLLNSHRTTGLYIGLEHYQNKNDNEVDKNHLSIVFYLKATDFTITLRCIFENTLIDS